MSVVLLVLGILITAAGLVAVGFGIKFSELDLGSTLILAGTTLASGGLILIGLGAAVRELSRISEALRPRPGARPGRPAEVAVAAEPSPVIITPRPPQVKAPPAQVAPPPAPVAPPVQAAPPPKGEAPPIRMAPPDNNIDVSASAIERLRSSLPRPDRGTPESEAAPPAPNGSGQHAPEPELPPEPRPVAVVPPRPPAAPATRAPDVPPPRAAEASARSNAATAETLKEPRLDFLFRSKPRAASQESFEAAWPKRPRTSDAPPRETKPAPPQATNGEDRRSAPPAGDEPRGLAILKSGVVDGMAYTLYTDGSIEAQLPSGTVRFGSIAELRAHIENNS